MTYNPNQVRWTTAPLEDIEPLMPTRFIGPGTMVRVITGKYEGREGRVIATRWPFMVEIEEGWK